MRAARFIKWGIVISILLGMIVAPLLFSKGFSSMTIFKMVNQIRNEANLKLADTVKYSGEKKKASLKEYKKLSSHIYLRGKMVPRNPRGIYKINGETIFYKDDSNATPALSNSLEVAEPTKAEQLKEKLARGKTPDDWQNFDNPADLLKATKQIRANTKTRAKILDELSTAQ